MIPEAKSLIFELDAAVSAASNSWHSELLRRVTDLFVGSCGNLSENQIAIFDDVFDRLTKNAEVPPLVELSSRLAPLDNAPPNVVKELSCSDDMAVSGPLLEKSNVLADQTLIDIATTKRQNHLVVIAGRAQISDAVSDALIERGNQEVVQRLIANHGARISELGFVKLIGHAKIDKSLAAAIAKRTDMPAELAPFLKLTLA
jgi:uncharacterized protein (DUF2336 family)